MVMSSFNYDIFYDGNEKTIIDSQRFICYLGWCYSVYDTKNLIPLFQLKCSVSFSLRLLSPLFPFPFILITQGVG